MLSKNIGINFLPNPPENAMNKKGELLMKKYPDGSQELSSKIYHGQILPPEMLKEYKEVDPEFPARLVKWSEVESEHRRICEKNLLKHKYVMSLSGHLCSIVATAAILLVAYLFMTKGYAREGMWIALSTSGVVGIFVIKKYITGYTKNNQPPE
jgi:hypothetical protein